MTDAIRAAESAQEATRDPSAKPGATHAPSVPLPALRKRYTLGERPAFQSTGEPLPAHWVICNAPRPLVGHDAWIGPFVSGIYYAAIDPETLEAARRLESNRRDDACELVYVTDAEMREAIRQRYAAVWLQQNGTDIFSDRYAVEWATYGLLDRWNEQGRRPEREQPYTGDFCGDDE